MPILEKMELGNEVSDPGKDESKEMGMVSLRMLEFCYLLHFTTC